LRSEEPSTRPRGRAPRRRTLVLAGLVAIAAVAAVVTIIVVPSGGGHPASKPSPVTHSPSAEYRVSTDGKGDCVVLACHTINAAVARAKADHAAGAVIELAGGNYGPQTVNEPKKAPTLASNIVVQPAVGAAVAIRGLTLNASNVTIKGVTFTGAVKFGTTAQSSGLDDVTTRGASVFLAASRSFVTGSSIAPPVDADGIQVKAYGGKNPVGVRIEHTSIGPTHRGPRKVHVDCIQVLGGSDVVIRYNRLFHCADEGVIVGSGASGTVSGTIDVERNEIQLCPQRTSDCDGHDAVSMRAPRVVFVHNTVIDGGATFDVSDLTVAANYIENLKTCGGKIESNLIAATNCSTLPSSNRRGALTFADPTGSPPDLTPRDPVAVPAGGSWVGGSFSDVDIDGHEVNPKSATVGAVQADGGS
jgi:hypothetical protein